MNSHTMSAENLLASFPQVLQKDEKLAALASSIADILTQRREEIRRVAIYPRIDELPEDLLDILAHDFKVDWYDPDYPLEVKRSLLKSCWSVHRQLGTKGAVVAALSGIYPEATVEEWFEYGGPPYAFRLEVKIPENGVTAEQQRRALENIEYYKNVRSWLEGVSYSYESHGEVTIGAYAAVASRIEIWPELVTSLDLTAKVETGGAVVAESRIEIYPEEVVGIGLTADFLSKSIHTDRAAHWQIALGQSVHTASDTQTTALVQAAGLVRATEKVNPQNIDIGQKVLASAECKRYVRMDARITASVCPETDALARMVALADPDPASLATAVIPVETGQGQALRTGARQSVFSLSAASAERRPRRQLLPDQNKTSTISSTDAGALPSQGVSAEKSTGITASCMLDLAWMPKVLEDGGLWIRQVYDDPTQQADGTLEVS